jgi:ABC-type Fe3+-hydroxamate transport system substrate-binding protein
MEEITVGTLFGLGFMLLVTAVTVVVIWQVAVSIRARAAVSREQEYRRLADQAVATQEAAQRQLAELSDRMADIQARMASLERVLKEVE